MDLAFWKKQAVDQGAHFVTAFAILGLAVLFGATITPLAGGVIGLALGTVREITEGAPVGNSGSVLDITYWMLGGLVAGLLF